MKYPILTCYPKHLTFVIRVLAELRICVTAHSYEYLSSENSYMRGNAIFVHGIKL
jgi:hypothetical protein